MKTGKIFQYKKLFGKQLINSIKCTTFFLVAITIIVILMAIVYDIVYCYKDNIFPSLHQFCKNVFDQRQELIPITVVIWTFSTVLFSFLLGKIDNRRYGVRLWDLIGALYGKSMIILVVCIFFAEPIILEVSVINCRVVVSFAAVVFVQFINTASILMLVGIGFSNTLVQNIIFKQNDDYFSKNRKKLFGHFLIVDMIQSINYDMKEEEDVAISILGSSLNKLEGIEGRRLANSIIINLCSARKHDLEQCGYMLRELFSKPYNITEEAQKGIMECLLSQHDYFYINLAIQILSDMSESPRQKCESKIKLYLWCVLWNKKFQGDLPLGDDLFHRFVDYDLRETFSYLNKPDDGILSTWLYDFYKQICDDIEADLESKNRLLEQFFNVDFDLYFKIGS